MSRNLTHSFACSTYWGYTSLYGWQCQVVVQWVIFVRTTLVRWVTCGQLASFIWYKAGFCPPVLVELFCGLKGTHLCLPRWTEWRSWGCGNADFGSAVQFWYSFWHYIVAPLRLSTNTGSLCPLAWVDEGVHTHTGLYKVTQIPFNASWRLSLSYKLLNRYAFLFSFATNTWVDLKLRHCNCMACVLNHWATRTFEHTLNTHAQQTCRLFCTDCSFIQWK